VLIVRALKGEITDAELTQFVLEKARADEDRVPALLYPSASPVPWPRTWGWSGDVMSIR
jgi:hypothetical protein